MTIIRYDANDFLRNIYGADKVEEYLDADFDSIPYAQGDAIGRTVDYFAGRNRYIGYLMTLAKHSFRNFKVGLDCANGSASAIAKSVFDALNDNDPGDIKFYRFEQQAI